MKIKRRFLLKLFSCLLIFICSLSFITSCSTSYVATFPSTPNYISKLKDQVGNKSARMTEYFNDLIKDNFEEFLLNNYKDPWAEKLYHAQEALFSAAEEVKNYSNTDPETSKLRLTAKIKYSTLKRQVEFYKKIRSAITTFSLLHYDDNSYLFNLDYTISYSGDDSIEINGDHFEKGFTRHIVVKNYKINAYFYSGMIVAFPIDKTSLFSKVSKYGKNSKEIVELNGTNYAAVADFTSLPLADIFSDASSIYYDEVKSYHDIASFKFKQSSEIEDDKQWYINNQLFIGFNKYFSPDRVFLDYDDFADYVDNFTSFGITDWRIFTDFLTLEKSEDSPYEGTPTFSNTFKCWNFSTELINDSTVLISVNIIYNYAFNVETVENPFDLNNNPSFGSFEYKFK